MTVGTASRPGTLAREEPAGDRCDAKPETMGGGAATARQSRRTEARRNRVTSARRSWVTQIKAGLGRDGHLRCIVHGFGVAAVLFTVT